MPSETAHDPTTRIILTSEASGLPSISSNYANREAREFAECEGLEGPLSRAIGLIPAYFRVVAPLIVGLGDSGTDPAGRALIIEVPVEGDPIEVSKAHWDYALKARALLGLQGERIIVVCDVREHRPS